MDTVEAAYNNQNNQTVSDNRLVSLVNSMADGVIAIDKKMTITLYNAAALNILDVNTINTKSQLLSDVFKPIDKNNQPVDLEKLFEEVTIPTVNQDFKLKYSDNNISNLYMSISPVRNDSMHSEKNGFIMVLRDITTEKSLEEEKDEFISVVSHELRTPIAITEGNISNAQLIAQKENASTNIINALNESHKQVIFLADMINDLSTLSRAERGKLTLEIEVINVVDLIKELENSYLADTQKKNLKLKVIIDPNLSVLKSSRLYVKEILQNFITNAIKYTPSGSITISAKQQPKAVLFSVSDTGIGISKADQDKIFDKFYRSEDFRTRQSSGTGLGLYITMKLARLTNADISFDSEINKGSTFNILFPNLEDIKSA